MVPGVSGAADGLGLAGAAWAGLGLGGLRCADLDLDLLAKCSTAEDCVVEEAEALSPRRLPWVRDSGSCEDGRAALLEPEALLLVLEGVEVEAAEEYTDKTVLNVIYGT